jgi:nucleoside-diphosphate-sugar epimerase
MLMQSPQTARSWSRVAAGDIGAIGRNLMAMLLAKGHKVRARVRWEDERADALRQLGADVTRGELTDLASMNRSIECCARVYFGMSMSPAYLEATVNVAAVARHHGVEAFVNISQMTVTQMSITERHPARSISCTGWASRPWPGRDCQS